MWCSSDKMLRNALKALFRDTVDFKDTNFSILTYWQHLTLALPSPLPPHLILNYNIKLLLSYHLISQSSAPSQTRAPNLIKICKYELNLRQNIRLVDDICNMLSYNPTITTHLSFLQCVRDINFIQKAVAVFFSLN